MQGNPPKSLTYEFYIIGGSCIAAGCFLGFTGFCLFDNGLLALGNILLLLGVTLALGISRVASLFIATDSLIGTIGFAGGLFLVLLGWARIGVAVEVIGLLWVFGGLIYPALRWMKTLLTLRAVWGST